MDWQRILNLRIAALVTALALLSVLLLSGYNSSSVIRDYQHTVAQPELRSVRVSYSWSSLGDWKGKGETLIGTLSSCHTTECVQGSTVLSGCGHRSLHCIPPWTPVTAMPADLLEPPLHGYPSKYVKTLSALLASSQTKCTSAMGVKLGPSVYANWNTLCINRAGMVLYRSVSL